MRYSTRQKVHNHLFSDTKLTKDDIAKEAILKLVSDIPLTELKKVFEVEILEPTDEALAKANLEMDHIAFDTLFRLKQENCSTFEVSIIIK